MRAVHELQAVFAIGFSKLYVRSSVIYIRIMTSHIHCTVSFLLSLIPTFPLLSEPPARTIPYFFFLPYPMALHSHASHGLRNSTDPTPVTQSRYTSSIAHRTT